MTEKGVVKALTVLGHRAFIRGTTPHRPIAFVGSAGQPTCANDGHPVGDQQVSDWSMSMLSGGAG
jgi:hypothetical protein